jgi:hypothetical protein
LSQDEADAYQAEQNQDQSTLYVALLPDNPLTVCIGHHTFLFLQKLHFNGLEGHCRL